ncbi:MAG: glycine cleavage system protein H [Desulfobacterales bacterium]|nr:glycine cleavage system protein H [Desulfobacterales bacterium]
MEFRTEQSAPACIWMQAGVVHNKTCVKDFHCTDCRFNQAMTRVCRDNQLAREGNAPVRRRSGKFVFWQDRLNRLPRAKRPCIHHMKGRIDFKVCPKAYHCIDCEFDQFFQDQFKVYTRVEQVGFNDVRGFALPAGYYLASGHTWIKIEGSGMVSIGIDDFASRLFGQFDSLSAPLMGKELTRGAPAFTLGRDKNRITFMSPVSGVITGINPHAQKNPGGIVKAPYTEGWLLTLFCPNLKQDLKNLMFMDTATQFIDASARDLHDFLEEKTGLRAADGGELVPDIYGNVPDVSWEDLVNTFILPPETDGKDFEQG